MLNGKKKQRMKINADLAFAETSVSWARTQQSTDRCQLQERNVDVHRQCALDSMKRDSHIAPDRCSRSDRPSMSTLVMLGTQTHCNWNARNVSVCKKKSRSCMDKTILCSRAHRSVNFNVIGKEKAATQRNSRRRSKKIDWKSKKNGKKTNCECADESRNDAF